MTDNYKEVKARQLSENNIGFLSSFSSQSWRFREEIFSSTQWKKAAVQSIITLNHGLEFWAFLAGCFEYWPSLLLGQRPLINKGKLIFISSSMSHYMAGLWEDVLRTYGSITRHLVWVLPVTQTLVKSKSTTLQNHTNILLLLFQHFQTI